MMKRIASWVTLAVSLVLIVIACGKDDGPVAPDTNNGTPNIAAQTLNAREDMAPGVIDNVSASDPDGDPITFSITTNSNNLFEISEDGELRLAADKQLDYESASSHELVVEVSDGTNSATETITVAVGNVPDEPFITTWKVVDGETLKIPTGGEYTYSCTVDWGDGIVETVSDNTLSHVYETADTYTVKIGIGFPSIEMKDSQSDNNLMSIEQWGEIEWKKLENAFYYCTNMVGNATDAPDLSQVTSLEGMFASAYSFNGDLNNWDVGNVENMASMFRNAQSFNSDLDNWNVNNVTDTGDMFNDAESFNGDISTWDVSNVENMRAMFVSANKFNQDLSSWKVGEVTNMAFMFHRAKAFTGEGISGWNVSKVTDMGDMFSYASSFDQDLSKWKVGEVTDMTSMFRDAENFDQDLGGWDISSVEDMAQMLDGSGLSPENFGNTLIGWANQGEDVPNDVTLGAEGLLHCNDEAFEAEDFLENEKGWTLDWTSNC